MEEKNKLTFNEYLSGGFLGFGLFMLITSILPSTPRVASTAPVLLYSATAIFSAVLAAYLSTRRLVENHLKNGLMIGVIEFLIDIFVSFPLSLVFPEGMWNPPLPIWGINLLTFSLGGVLGGLLAALI